MYICELHYVGLFTYSEPLLKDTSEIRTPL